MDGVNDGIRIPQDQSLYSVPEFAIIPTNMYDFERNQSSKFTRASACLLLGLWLVILLGFLTISFLSVTCTMIDRQCSSEFIDGVQAVSHHIFQIEFTAFLFFFMYTEIIQPVSLLRSPVRNTCCPAWSLCTTVSPPPRAFA